MKQSKQYSSGNTMKVTTEKNQESALDLALQLKDAGKFSQAIDLLKDEVHRLPENASMLALLSQCYLLKDQVEAAKHFLKKAKDIDANNASVGWNTARLLLKENKPSEALHIAREISQKYPDDVEGMGVFGACLSVNGEIVDSIRVLNRAIELNPNYAEAFIARGLVRLSQDHKFEALADLERAHRLKPHINKIWSLVISLKIEAQKHSDAILLLTDMIKIDPKGESRLVILALCYHHLRDFESAIDAYKKALAIKPDYAEAHYNMGNTLKVLGMQEAAIQAYTKAIATKPDYAEAYYNMSNVFKEQGKFEQAREGYIKTLAIKPEYAGVHNNLGITLKEQGKIDEAIAAFNTEIWINPDNAASYNNMGNAF
jgi:tetratricopeptide (TPR) repeat protein